MNGSTTGLTNYLWNSRGKNCTSNYLYSCILPVEIAANGGKIYNNIKHINVGTPEILI